MNKFFSKTLVAAVLVGFLFTACTEDSEVTPDVKSTLTSQTWIFNTFDLNEVSETDTAALEITLLWSFEYNNAELTFTEDGKVYKVTDALFVEDGKEYDTLSYELIKDNQVLRIVQEDPDFQPLHDYFIHTIEPGNLTLGLETVNGSKPKFVFN